MNPESTSSKRSRWLPSLSTFIWLAFFLALVLSSWRLVLISADGDPCLHWRIGKWMIEHHAVLRADQFSHTRFGAPLISKEWLSEVIFTAVGNWGGWTGIVLLSAALIATSVWLLHRQLLAEGCELLLAAAMVLVAAEACSMHWLARPHLVTQLLVVVFGWLLRGFAAGRVSYRRLLLTLVPAMLLWTNLHGAFFVGFVMLGIYGLGAIWERRWVQLRQLIWLSLACVFVSLVNPNGWHLHAQVIGFLRSPELAQMANEFRSPNFHTKSAEGFTLLLGLIGGVLLVARPRLKPTEILLMAVWGYFALHSARNIPVFALVVVPVIAGHLNEFVSALPESRWITAYRNLARRMAGLDARASGWLLALIMVGITVVFSGKLAPTEILPDRFPVVALQKVDLTELKGEMFNDYGWGGYLMLYLPERKVFIDGRNDFYGKEVVEEFNRVDELRPDWEEVFTKRNVGWVILPPKHQLCTLLGLRADWRLVYQDKVTAIYARR